MHDDSPKPLRQSIVKPNVVHVRSCEECPFLSSSPVELETDGQVREVAECRGAAGGILLEDVDTVPDFCPRTFNVYVWPGVEVSQ